MITLRTLRSLLLPFATLALAGCASDMSPVSIQGFEFIAIKDGVCMPSGANLVQSRLDTALGTGYMVAVKVANDLASNADVTADRVNSNTVYLDTAEVTFRASKGAGFQTPAAERIPVSIVVPAGGKADAAMQVLSVKNGETLQNAELGFLIVEVRLTGKTADGAAVASTPAEFPVQICKNCVNPCGSGEEIVAACSPGQSDGVICDAVGDGT